MSAKIEIVIDRLEDVLCVPLQAVASRKKLKLCYLVTPRGLEARPVETGQFNDSFIEIKAGLSEGDVVSLLPPRLDEEREDGKRKKRGDKDGKQRPPDDARPERPARGTRPKADPPAERQPRQGAGAPPARGQGAAPRKRPSEKGQ